MSPDPLLLRLLPDLHTPLSGDQVLCVGACLRIWHEQVVGRALVQHVLARLRLLTEDVRHVIPHRAAARALIEQMLAPFFPSLDTNGLASTHPHTLIWHAHLLRDYEDAWPRVQALLRQIRSTPARIRACQAVFPPLSPAVLTRLVDRAGPRKAKGVTQACLAHLYGDVSAEAIRKALRRAQHVRALRVALVATMPL